MIWEEPEDMNPNYYAEDDNSPEWDPDLAWELRNNR